MTPLDQVHTYLDSSSRGVDRTRRELVQTQHKKQQIAEIKYGIISLYTRADKATQLLCTETPRSKNAETKSKHYCSNCSALPSASISSDDILSDPLNLRRPRISSCSISAACEPSSVYCELTDDATDSTLGDRE